ncbi:MAG TPA: MogA/MoaB family molybdenum cofactor biosynthesis protein [Acidimicrobiales bacterium]|jgi:molybdenum cofactor synthesis domain-containing protein|nr:MogA/MoaB family molybdenum cofactor biosynthesis protein [Acidimicrobiales bacterium]
MTELPSSSVPLRAKVLTVSETVFARRAEDRGGDAISARLVAAGYDVVERRAIPDGVGPVSEALVEFCAGFSGIVVTTGGTGFAPTDNTPEGTVAVLDRQAPGLAEAMRLANPLGRLSRAVAGTLGEAVVINTPGSPAGAVEYLDAVIEVLPHAIGLLAGHNPHPHRTPSD